MAPVAATAPLHGFNQPSVAGGEAGKRREGGGGGCVGGSEDAERQQPGSARQSSDHGEQEACEVPGAIPARFTRAGIRTRNGELFGRLLRKMQGGRGLRCDDARMRISTPVASCES